MLREYLLGRDGLLKQVVNELNKSARSITDTSGKSLRTVSGREGGGVE